MLQGLRTRILLWTILPLAVILIGAAYLGVNSHQAAMRELVAERDGALGKVAAARLSELLANRARELEQIDAAHPETWNTNAFDGGVALLDSTRNVTLAVPNLEVWHARLDRIPRDALFSEPFLEGGHWYVVVTRRRGPDLIAGAFRLPGLDGPTPRSNMYLVNSQGIIIADTQPGQVGTNLSRHEGIAEVMRGESGATYHKDLQGQEIVVGYAPVTPVGWGLLIDEPWAEVIAPMFQYTVLLPLILVLVAVFALGAIYFGVSNIVRPLQTLSQMANRIAFGDYQAAANPVGGVREIEELRETLDRMARQVRSAQEALQSYITAITRGQEEERKRLARELHDDTIQSLIALQQRVEMTQKALSRDPTAASAKLGELKSLLNDSLASVRRFVRDLRPTYLEELGLIPALETLARESNASFEVQGEERRLDGERELVLFRIVQEALRNVNKHAQASQVAVKLAFDSDEVTATVEDNGIGFNAPDAPAAYARAGHFGLTGMQERAQLFGGSVYVKSERGKGTKVLAYIPTANGIKA